MDTIQEDSLNTEDEQLQSDFILSLCWDRSTLSAVYYNIETMELHVMQEVHELRPDYPALGNLFRQVKPSHLVCSGPKLFLEDLIKLLDLPLETDLNKFKIKKNQANITNITIYPTINKTNMRDFRKKIYNLNLPGIPSECSETDRQIFIDSAFPMYQNLMVHSLGNLLKFLEENSVKFRELFLNFEKVPIITNILVFFMESQVLIDESTFNALNIFSAVYHPSSFKDQIKKDGLSLFNLLNQCCSAIGVQCLKSMLKQPIRDIIELNLRYSTIEWCTIKNNFCHVIKIRGYLKNLLNINQLVRRILANFGNSIDWIYLKKTIYYAVLLCRLCAQLDKSSIQATFLMDLARYTREEQVIQGVLYALDKIVDLEAIYISKKFCIKKGLDDKLDEKRARLQDLKTQEYEEFEPNLLQISAEVGAFTLVYFPEIGFVLGTELNLDDLQLDDIQEDDIELVLQTIDAIYFRTPYCRVINEQYDTLRVDVIGHELLIFQGLIEYINANMAQLIEINKLCAKLDVLISMASVAISRKYVRPTITTEKSIEIIGGRHPLVETIKAFSPNTTIINKESKNFIQILNAPNASGKSVYMKQVASICYLAHIGCFVPADKCCVSLLHSINSRIHSPESIEQGQSSFMADLQQMSKIIMSSNDRSLVLIDEFGKGTSDVDGLALLTASVDHLVERGYMAPITFVATHYYDIHKLLKSKQMTALRTIRTEQNRHGVFESVYQVTSGKNRQKYYTEFPESKMILSNIFENDVNGEQNENMTAAYNTSIKIFMITLLKMFLRKNYLSHFFVFDLYNRVDLDEFTE